MLGSVKVDRFSSLDTDVSVSFFWELEHCWKMVVIGIQRDTQVCVFIPQEFNASRCVEVHLLTQYSLNVFIPQEFNASRCVEVHLLTQYSLNLEQLDWLCTSVDKLREKFIPKILR